MIPVFSGGVSCTAILIAIVFVDMIVVRVSKIVPVVARHHAESSWTFCLAQAFTLLMGCVLALGMWEVAQLPWNIFLWQHLKWAFRLFGAGFFALIGNAVSLWMLPTVSLEDHRHKLWTLRIQVSLLVLATLLLFLMKHYTHYAFQSWADAFEYFHTAKVDFHGYCSEKSFDAKSGQAVMEWLFTMCLLGSIVTFYQEFNNVRQDIWCSADCKPLLPRQRLLKGQSEGP